MYGNRTFGVPNKKPSSDRPKCSGCGMEKPRHPPADCFTTNHEKRKAWEKEHDKKWIIMKNGKKVDGSDSKSKKSKKDKDKDKGKKKDNEKSESDDDEPRFGGYTGSRYALTTEYKITKAMSVLKSMRWLVDTRADQYFCYSREQFDSYTQNTNMTSINTANGPSRPLGSGTVVLQCILSNGKTVPLTLKNVIHLPTVPVNLFGAGKLLDQYNGHVGGRKLRNSKLEEFA